MIGITCFPITQKLDIMGNGHACGHMRPWVVGIYIVGDCNHQPQIAISVLNDSAKF